MANAIRADRAARSALLNAPMPEASSALEAIAIPVLLITGVDDTVAGSPEALAARLPQAESVRVPGDHFTANSSPELHATLLEFLARVSS